MKKEFLLILLSFLLFTGFQCYKDFYEPPIIHEFDIPAHIINPQQSYNTNDTLWIESIVNNVRDNLSGQQINLKDSSLIFYFSLYKLTVNQTEFQCEVEKIINTVAISGSTVSPVIGSDTSFIILATPLISGNNAVMSFGIVLNNPGYFMISDFHVDGHFRVSRIIPELTSSFYNLEKRFELPQARNVRRPDEYYLRQRWSYGSRSFRTTDYLIKVI
jgi:hypothetical protein